MCFYNKVKFTLPFIYFQFSQKSTAFDRKHNQYKYEKLKVSSDWFGCTVFQKQISNKINLKMKEAKMNLTTALILFNEMWKC